MSANQEESEIGRGSSDHPALENSTPPNPEEGATDGRSDRHGDAPKQGGWFDRKLEKLGQRLSDPGSRSVLKRSLIGKIRKLIWIISMLYLVGVPIGLAIVGWVGERNLFTALMLYVPPLTWLFPAFPLALVVFFFSRKLFCCYLAWVPIYLLWIMDFGLARSGDGVAEGDFGITVQTFNRGQRSGSLVPLFERWKPDVLATQEGGSAKGLLRLKGYERFSFGKTEGEFVLLSKFPITGSGILTGKFGDEEDKRMAAWFELEVGEGQSLVIYNVHLPTPREAIRANLFGGALYGIVGIPGTGWGDERRRREEFWQGRIDLADQLLAHLEAETKPYLVVGDFNMPARGHIYRKVASNHIDAHRVAGNGYGFTFPGKTRNPLGLFRPWLRLDYLFAGKGWKIEYCETERRGRGSQHQSVVARFARDSDSF